MEEGEEGIFGKYKVLGKMEREEWGMGEVRSGLCGGCDAGVRWDITSVVCCYGHVEFFF